MYAVLPEDLEKARRSLKRRRPVRRSGFRRLRYAVIVWSEPPESERLTTNIFVSALWYSGVVLAVSDSSEKANRTLLTLQAKLLAARENAPHLALVCVPLDTEIGMTVTRVLSAGSVTSFAMVPERGIDLPEWLRAHWGG